MTNWKDSEGFFDLLTELIVRRMGIGFPSVLQFRTFIS